MRWVKPYILSKEYQYKKRKFLKIMFFIITCLFLSGVFYGSLKNNVNDVFKKALLFGKGLLFKMPIAPDTKINITQALIAEDLDSKNNPIGINTKFSTGNKTLYYFVNYSRAIPNKTVFNYRWYKNGNQINSHQNTIENETGYDWNAFTYDFKPGEYEVRLYVDDQEITKTAFNIIQEQSQIRVIKSVVAEGMSANEPIGAASVFHVAQSATKHLVYYMEYKCSNCSIEKLSVKWFKDGNLIYEGCSEDWPDYDIPYFICDPKYDFSEGHYEARLILNGREEIDRTFFSVQAKVVPEEKEANAPQYTPQPLPTPAPPVTQEYPIKVKQITGEVIRKDDKTVTVQGKKAALSLNIDSTTKVRQGRESKTFADIKVGDKVVAKFIEGNGQNLAKSVNIKGEADSKDIRTLSPFPAPSTVSPRPDPRTFNPAATESSSSVPSTVKVIILSSPSSATVFIDRKKVGITPLMSLELKQGSHGISLEKEGYETFYDMIKVERGDKIEFNFTLMQK